MRLRGDAGAEQTMGWIARQTASKPNVNRMAVVVAHWLTLKSYNLEQHCGSGSVVVGTYAVLGVFHGSTVAWAVVVTSAVFFSAAWRVGHG